MEGLSNNPDQIPVDDPLWERAPGVLARGHHLEDDTLVLHELAWFGVSTFAGRNFAIRANSWPMAKERLIKEHPSIELLDGGFFWEIHSDSYDKDGEEIRIHEDLDARYPDRDVVQMKPFSIEEITPQTAE
jgi:hypothetical protein